MRVCKQKDYKLVRTANNTVVWLFPCLTATRFGTPKPDLVGT